VSHAERDGNHRQPVAREQGLAAVIRPRNVS